MASFREEIHLFRARRGQTRETLGGVKDEQLTASTDGHGDVRSRLLRIATLMFQRRVELATTFAALGWQQTDAQRILALAMESRGELRSIVLGVPDEHVDRAPAPEEWTVRQTLEHAHAVDRRYMMGIEYAVERAHSPIELPLQRPSSGMPAPAGDGSLSGGLASILAELHMTRDEVVARLCGITDADLSAPSMYGGHQVDVRYRLHVLAAHEREHTGQVARTLRALGFQQTEAQMILGQAEVARGSIEGMFIGIPDQLLTQRPPGGLPSVHHILATAVSEESAVADGIVSAVA